MLEEGTGRQKLDRASAQNCLGCCSIACFVWLGCAVAVFQDRVLLCSSGWPQTYPLLPQSSTWIGITGGVPHHTQLFSFLSLSLINFGGHMCPGERGQRATCRSWLSPAMWIPEIKLRTPSLVASTFPTESSQSPHIQLFFKSSNSKPLILALGTKSRLCYWGQKLHPTLCLLPSGLQSLVAPVCPF